MRAGAVGQRQVLTTQGVAITPHAAALARTGRPPAPPSVSLPISTPMCPTCGNDDGLVYPEYLEQGTPLDGVRQPAWARYCCTRCGGTRQHEVPVSWRPPGWFGCT